MGCKIQNILFSMASVFQRFGDNDMPIFTSVSYVTTFLTLIICALIGISLGKAIEKNTYALLLFGGMAIGAAFSAYVSSWKRLPIEYEEYKKKPQNKSVGWVVLVSLPIIAWLLFLTQGSFGVEP